MDKIEQLHQLYTYDCWANKKMAEALSGQLFDTSKKCLALLAHICAAQVVWFERINGRPTDDIDLWPANYSTRDSWNTLKKLHKNWLQLLKENTNYLYRIIAYKNTADIEFNTPLAGIMHHVIIHGQHHRAQISTLLRQGNINPPLTDFIFYLRETNNA